MSVKIMAAVWELDLPQNKKLVLLALADHADDQGLCYPSVPRIAWKTGLSDRQVQRIGKELKKAELIVLLKNEKGGRGRSAWYRILPQNGDKLSPFIEPEKGDAGDTVSEKRVTPAAGKGDIAGKKGDIAMSPESSVRTIREPSVGVGQQNRPTPPSVPIIALPLNDGSEHPIQANQVEEWKGLYPAVNVPQELRNMRGWLLANPRNRKTKVGVLKFVNRWLAIEQNKAPRRGSASPAGPTADEILRQKREGAHA